MKRISAVVLAFMMVTVFGSVANAVTLGDEWGMVASGGQVPEAGGSNHDIDLNGGWSSVTGGVDWNTAPAYGVALNTASSNPGTSEVAIGARITSDPITGAINVSGYSGNVIQKGLWADDGQIKAQLIRKNDGTFNCRFKGTLGNTIVQAPPVADNVDDGNVHYVVCSRSGSTLTVNVDGDTNSTQLNIGSLSNNKNVHVGNKNGSGGQLDQHYGKNLCSAYAYGSGAITYVTNLVSGNC